MLFGAHQFILHPLFVLFGWIKLYGLPGWRELICIIIHDWGYWGCKNIDGNEGKRHPEFAANLAGVWFGIEYYRLCLFHSRYYANTYGAAPSKLCWADKYSIAFEPFWFYWLRTKLSGELDEYRRVASFTGHVAAWISDKEWFNYVKNRMIRQGLKKQGTSYQ